jgi:hypothetical protein
MKLLLSGLMLLNPLIFFAQVGIGTTSPSVAAALDVTSTTKGFLPPRMTAAQRVNIPAPTPAGLIIWCSDCGTSGELQVFNGSAWTNMIGSAANGLPVLSATTAATSITSSSALSGGNVTSDGGSAVTERGICWNTSSNPTIAHSKFISTGTTGSFSATLTGLTAQTIYYVRAYATNAYGISYGTQISFRSGDPSVGDSFGGGKVAYILQSGDPGYDINVMHGIIAATIDQSSGTTWSNGNTTASHLSTGATATALGTGFTNTETIITIQGNSGSYAAKLCRDYRGGGYSDWYLPSKDELNKLYINNTLIGLALSGYYWSSSENRTESAWVQSFGSGLQLDYWTKSNNSNSVRAVRSF